MLEIDSEKLYPHADEMKEFPGFRRMPFSTDSVAVNEDGVVIRLPSGKVLKQTLTVRGYRTCSVRIKQGVRTPYLVHRMVASLFVPVPLRHANKDRSELQVNHKDGNKQNNCHQNLEWVTAKENMDHAYDEGLLDSYIKRPVLAKDIRTGKVIRFETIRECCKVLCLDKNMLYKHLTSNLTAGRVVCDGRVFKFDDDTVWPDLLAIEHPGTTLWRSPDIVGRNTKDDEIFLFLNLRQACEFLKLNFYSLQNHRYRVGADVPYNDWIFYTLSEECFQKGKQ